MPQSQRNNLRITITKFILKSHILLGRELFINHKLSISMINLSLHLIPLHPTPPPLSPYLSTTIFTSNRPSPSPLSHHHLYLHLKIHHHLQQSNYRYNDHLHLQHTPDSSPHPQSNLHRDHHIHLQYTTIRHHLHSEITITFNIP